MIDSSSHFFESQVFLFRQCSLPRGSVWKLFVVLWSRAHSFPEVDWSLQCASWSCLHSEAYPWMQVAGIFVKTREFDNGAHCLSSTSGSSGLGFRMSRTKIHAPLQRFAAIGWPVVHTATNRATELQSPLSHKPHFSQPLSRASQTLAALHDKIESVTAASWFAIGC
jgi:hypothetical protein